MRSEPVLFVSGAGLPEWIWDGVRTTLGVESSDVARVPPEPDATLRDLAEAALASAPSGGFTIVAHSLGGVVASGVLALAPERVRGVLGIAAAFPGARRSYADALPAPGGLLLRVVTALAGTRPPEGAIRAMTLGLPDEVADRLVADFAPAPRRAYVDRLPSWWRPPVRAGYVLTTADAEFPLPLQERFARAIGARWTGRLETGHLPMLADPAGTARCIGEFLTTLD